MKFTSLMMKNLPSPLEPEVIMMMSTSRALLIMILS